MSILRDAIHYDLRLRGSRLILAEVTVATILFGLVGVVALLHASEDPVLRAQVYVVLSIALNSLTLFALILSESRRNPLKGEQDINRARVREYRGVLLLLLVLPALLPILTMSHLWRVHLAD